RAMESPEHFEAGRHGLRIEAAVLEDAFTQARYFTILVQRNQAATTQFGDAQANGVRADIDGGKYGHRRSSGFGQRPDGADPARLFPAGRDAVSREQPGD